jgi:transposase
MASRKRITDNIDVVITAMKNAESVDEFRRLQCVFLGDTMPELTAESIGEITQYSASSVKRIHADFRKNGLLSIKDQRGGRYRENLTLEQEEKLLSQFDELSKTGKLVEISKLKIAYEKILGRKVNKTVIYRMLDRHGYRKIVPYKRHPKADIEEQSAFKKTSKT